MKRELYCSDCNRKTEDKWQSLALEDGLPFDVRLGVLLKDGLICDFCSDPLKLGNPAVARTLASHRGEPLSNWSDDYLRALTSDETFEMAMKDLKP